MIDQLPEENRCRRAIENLSKTLLLELETFAFTVYKKYSKFSSISQEWSESLVQIALLKVMNGEIALIAGHATIRNGRIQLKNEIRNSNISEKYKEGIRHWNPEKHEFITFIKLVIVSEVRNKLQNQKRSEQINENTLEGSVESPEVAIQRKNDLETFILSLDSAELRGIANCLLIEGKEKLDLQLEYGLTRSQVDKRIIKLINCAKDFSILN